MKNCNSLSGSHCAKSMSHCTVGSEAGYVCLSSALNPLLDLKENWRYPQLQDYLLLRTKTAYLDWWQNPLNVLTGSDLHHKDHNIQIFTNASNAGLRHSFRSRLRKRYVVTWGNRLHINVLELKAVFLTLNSSGISAKLDSVDCHRQCNCGNLYKQTEEPMQQRCMLSYERS